MLSINKTSAETKMFKDQCRWQALRSLAMIAVAAALTGTSASAQDLPTKPIRIVSPFATGTGPDIVARLLGEKLSKSLQQPVVVDAKPGGNGFIAAEEVKRAPADGTVMLLVDNGHVTINPALFSKLPYDVERDFAPVGLLFRTPFFVAVSTSGPYRSVADLIGAAKAKPGEVSYGTPFVGSPSHLGSALLESLTGTQMIHVPFKETPQLWTAISTGEVSWGLGTIASTRPMVQSGRLKLMAIAASQRLPTHSTIPTVAELGGPSGYEVNAWVALLAPRATPTRALQRLNAEINNALQEKDLLERFVSFGFEPTPSTVSQLADLIRADTRKFGELVKRTGAKAD
ncbi:MAG: tripartite tricarboxylate transporter substrate binding protein [Rhodoferax sp.]|nr:tripartite tricarboxylate transporter substrate binding protein [Rhodoferax sp.]